MSSVINSTTQPGSMDTGTVNLFTGSVSFPVTLSTLPGQKRVGVQFIDPLQQ